MIDVRTPLADLDDFLYPGSLAWLVGQGLRSIDLHPAVSGPEVELTFAGGENDQVALSRALSRALRLRSGQPPAHLTVLAIRYRAA